MAQTLEFSATDGMTLTATLCAVGSYTGTNADSVTQQSGTNRYLAVFSANSTGAYRLDVKSAGTPILAEVYDLAGSGTFQPRTEQPNTTTPPTAAAVSTQVAADLAAAHGAGGWTTADVSALATAAALSTLSTEVSKVPRADAALTAGEAVQKTLGDAFTAYVQEKIRKVP